jgi:hypothetical protein
MAVVDKTAAPASPTTKIRCYGSRIALAEPVIGRRFAPTRWLACRDDVSERNLRTHFQTHLRLPAARFARALQIRLPLIEIRGRREDRVRAAPAVSRAR